MTDAGLRRSNDLFGREHAVADQEYNKYLGDSQANQAQYRTDYGTLVDSARQQGELEKQHANNQVDLLHREIDFNDHSAQLAKRIMLDGQVVRDKYLGQYREQLTGVRQLALMSGNPLTKLSTGEVFGLGFAQFAQGFLAARGINIDVNGQIDRWVQRGMQEHQQMLSNLRDSANDQFHLYEIARQNSNDDWEALQKYKGMVIEGFKASVEMEAARFDASTATARAQQRISDLNLQQDQIIEQLGEKRRAAYVAFHQQAALEAHYKGQLAIESAKAAEEARYHQGLLDAKNAKDKPWYTKISDPSATVRDPSGKLIGVKNLWQVDPNAPKEIQGKAAEAANKEGGAYATGIAQLQKLRELRPPAMEDFTARYGYWNATKQYNEAYRDFKRQRDLIGEQLITYLTGAAAPEEQMKRITGVLADDSGFQKGSNAAGVDQLEKWMRSNFTARMNQTVGIVPLPPEQQDVKPVNDAPNDTDAAYNARFSGTARTPLIAREEAQAAQGSDAVVELPQGKAERGDGRPHDTTVTTYAPVPGQPTGAWRELKTETVPDSSHSPPFVPSPPKTYRQFQDQHKNTYWEPGEREFAVHIDTMARAVVDPESLIKAHGADERPEQVAKDARDGLERLANDEHIPAFRREYAALLLKRLDDPEKLLRDLNDHGEPPKYK